MRFCNRVWLLLLALMCCSFYTHAGQFVVSTHPIYLIAKSVTQGIETPQLLLDSQSGHHVQLTPQQRKLIQDAELVLWLGRQHEAPLEKLLKNHPNSVALLDTQMMILLPLRNLRGQNIANTLDSHVWLEPNNAIRIAYFIAILRAQQNPSAKERYLKNANHFRSRLLAAARPYENSNNAQPYWAYHDAYQYLERALNLKLVATLTDDPEVPPSAGQLMYLNRSRPHERMCLLAEANVNRNLFNRLQPVVFRTVSESFATEQDFVNAWKKLANTVSQCIKATNSQKLMLGQQTKQ